MMRNKILVGIFALLLVFGGLAYLSSQTAQTPTEVATEQQDFQVVEDDGVAITCSGEATPSLTEGPYYKANSPERNDIAEGQEGESLVVEGYVLNTDCEPIAGAWLDFWQAGADGNYDLVGYNLRGHQYTDEMGRFRLESVIPARYSGRTPHIHLKVRANDASEVLTTQLFFPGEAQNQTDSIFRESLVVDLREEESGNIAHFNFVLNSD